ncbi:MAG TPA: Gfo/Idh/MocA family oxidoreductase [Opitutaceae bacterium]|nr:Gfo/Idh/MocA family oxidoreductase [Opitutaceae bacterium]
MTLLTGVIVGFGNVGRALTRFLRERGAADARIIGACDPDPAARAIAEREFGLTSTDSLAELLRAKPDFVVIASTSSAHAEQVEQAASAGCHVFCEKPISLTLADADRAIAAAERAGVVNQVNYSLRYIEAYRTLHDWTRNGRFGRLLAVTHIRTRGFGLHSGGARHPAVISPEMSGGWAVHHACHGLDLLYWLNGPFASVYGRTVGTISTGAEELVHAELTFGNGAIGHVGDSVCGLRDHYTMIVGEAGSAVLTGEREHTVLRYRAEGASDDEIVPVRDVKDHGVAFRGFFDCIRRGQPSPHSLREARPSLAAALALQESARTGQVVRLLD